MTKPFTLGETVHQWPSRPSITVHRLINNNTPGASVLWHFLGPLFLGPLYDFDTSWGLIMIVKLPWASLWLWNFLEPLYDYGTSCGPYMIVACPEASLLLWLLSLLLWHLLIGASLWLCNFMGPPNDCDTSCNLLFLILTFMQTLPSHEIVKIPNLCILQPVI